MTDSKFSNILLIGIVAALILAWITVSLSPEFAVSTAWLGTFFLTALKMIIVPLVLASVVMGMARLGDIRKASGATLRTLGYYALTTSISVFIGVLIVVMIAPGSGIAETTDMAALAVDEAITAKGDLGPTDIILSFIHPNIFGAMGQPDMLPVIVFSLILGAILTTMGEKGKPLIAFFDSLYEAMMKFVLLILWIAPIGIYGLVAGKFGEAAMTDGGIAALFAGLARFCAAVIGGLSFHALVILPLLCWLLARRNPFKYGLALSPALLTAFSTASSSGTLPVTIESATVRGGVSDRAAGFVLPLGATVNMDGTALYEAVAVIFICQAFNIDLTLGQLITIFILATVTSIGAAGVPSASIAFIVIILTSVFPENPPVAGLALILPVDWFLDRLRTTVNVWGDAIGAAVIDRTLPPTEEEMVGETA
ncbi:MAG: dicarboxylate/amino acid:cation symporter [Sumerlaeia bacterium]